MTEASRTGRSSAWIDQGQEWLDAGAVQLVVEARESAQGVGLFDKDGRLNTAYADRFVDAFGFDIVVFEAPNKPSQFALLNHFGRDVHLCNVRLEELLRVEIYRRGLHSDAFGHAKLRPGPLKLSRSEQGGVVKGRTVSICCFADGLRDYAGDRALSQWMSFAQQRRR